MMQITAPETGLPLMQITAPEAVPRLVFERSSPTKSAASGVAPPITIADGLGLRPKIFTITVPEETSAADTDDPLLDVVAVGNPVQFNCTGILVASQVVLTAGHCLPSTRVLFGSSVGLPILVSPVNRALRADPGIDVALLWIDGAATMPVRAWHDVTDGEPASLGKIAGFGATNYSATRGAGEKRTARVPLQGWGCDLSRVRTTGCLPNIELLVATPGGVDTCDGDSGGPLLERVGRQWRLLGITSRSLASARKRCGEGGIYIRIDKISAWLQHSLASTPTIHAEVR